jgi:hypothetical protein
MCHSASCSAVRNCSAEIRNCTVYLWYPLFTRITFFKFSSASLVISRDGLASAFASVSPVPASACDLHRECMYVNRTITTLGAHGALAVHSHLHDLAHRRVVGTPEQHQRSRDQRW